MGATLIDRPRAQGGETVPGETPVTDDVREGDRAPADDQDAGADDGEAGAEPQPGGVS